MSVSVLTANQLLGLFELDSLGKVLYYRMDAAGTSPDMTGFNFYDEVASFENVEEFRRCVTDFTLSAKVADSFDFDCHYEGSEHRVRVLMARIRERVNRTQTKSVLLHIREEITKGNTRRYERGERDERDVEQ